MSARFISEANRLIMIKFLLEMYIIICKDNFILDCIGYGLDGRGSRVRFSAGAGDFSLHHRVQNGSGAHPPSYSMGTRGSFVGVKWPGREADHSPHLVPRSKNAWSYTSTPPIRLHGVVLCLEKQRDNFIWLSIILVYMKPKSNVNDFLKDGPPLVYKIQNVLRFSTFVSNILSSEYLPKYKMYRARSTYCRDKK
jgi:hypothetical protein